jgi:hypothetical protein
VNHWILAAMAIASSAAAASPTYEYTYGYDGEAPQLILSSAGNGTINLVGGFVLTDVNDWDAAAEAANDRSLSYTYSYSSGTTSAFSIVYTVCDSADCDVWRSYTLADATSDDRPAVSVFYGSPTHSIGVLYYLESAAYAVPEPVSAVLMLAGGGLLSVWRRRRT